MGGVDNRCAAIPTLIPEGPCPLPGPQSTNDPVFPVRSHRTLRLQPRKLHSGVSHAHGDMYLVTFSCLCLLSPVFKRVCQCLHVEQELQVMVMMEISATCELPGTLSLPEVAAAGDGGVLFRPQECVWKRNRWQTLIQDLQNINRPH